MGEGADGLGREQTAKMLHEVAERSSRILTEFGQKHFEQTLSSAVKDELGIAKAYMAELEGKSHDERVRIVARLRDREGYAAEAVLDREGRPRGVVERHCPIQSMAERWPEICRLEEDLIRRALGEGVQREEHLLSGGRCCKYRVDVV